MYIKLVNNKKYQRISHFIVNSYLCADYNK